MSTPMIWGRLRDHIFDSVVNWWFGFGPYRLSRLGVEDWGNKQKLGFLHDSFGMIATASHYHLWYTHISIYILGAWPFSCRGTWSRATHAVPLGVGIHTHVSTQFMFLFLSVVYRLSHWHASFHTHTHTLKWFVVLTMQKRIVTASILHQSKKEQNALAHWTCCMFFCVLVFGKACATIQIQHAWAQPCFYQPQLYILPCLTKATKAKCTGTKTKSMQCFVYMFFFVKLMLVLIEQNALAQSCFTACLSVSKCNSPPKQERTERTGTLNMLYVFLCILVFGKACATIQIIQHAWAQPCFYQPQLYILPCLTKATKAKCTGTKTKSMQCFVYMFFFVKLMLVLIEQNALAQSCFTACLSVTKCNSPPKQERTERTGTLNMLYVFLCILVFGKACATIQIQNALAHPCFLPASALYPALPHSYDLCLAVCPVAGEEHWCYMTRNPQTILDSIGCSVLAGWLHGPFTKTSLGRCVWSQGRS